MTEVPASPIDIPSIPDVVYRELRRDIARGVYKPGPIRIRPIAERFGVSPTPVREALRRLDDLVEVSAQGSRGVGEPVLQVDDEDGRTVADAHPRADPAARVDLARVLDVVLGYVTVAAGRVHDPPSTIRSIIYETAHTLRLLLS